MARSDSQKRAEKKYEKKRAERSKNWAVVVYPESAPEKWVELVREQFIDALVSPLHDKDFNADGEVKKAHYHMLMSFPSLKTKEQIKEVLEECGITIEPQRVSSFRSYARYLCHLDNPDKAQYSQSDVIEIGCCDYRASIGRASDKYTAIAEMIEWCSANNIHSYAELLKYSMEYNEDWFRCLCDNGTYTMKEFLKSSAWESRQ